MTEPAILSAPDPARIEELVHKHVPFLEVHLTNQCNQRCYFCNYLSLHPQAVSLRFSDLDRIAQLRPEEITLVGGGNPTLYRDGDKNFSDAVLRLRELLPCTQLRLIDNGTIKPPGNWVDEIDQISISLDSATREEYIREKGRDFFQTVLGNIEAYLDETSIPRVRVTVVYHSAKLAGCMRLARRLWQIWRRRKDRLTEPRARNFQFLIFPRADDASPDRPFEGTSPSESELKTWCETLDRVREGDVEFWGFINRHTNLATEPLRVLRTVPMTRCQPVANYLVVGADRTYYPCFTMCQSARDANLGSLDQSVEELHQRRLRHYLSPPSRCRTGCRPVTAFYGLIAFDRLCVEFREGIKRKIEEVRSQSDVNSTRAILADLQPLWGVVGVLELVVDKIVLRLPARTDPARFRSVVCWVATVLLPELEILATVDTELEHSVEVASGGSEEPTALYYPDFTQPFVIERSLQPVVQPAIEEQLENDVVWHQIDGITVQDLQDDSVTSVTVADRSVILVKRSDSIQAFQGTCPHQGGRLGPGVLTRDGCIVCPLHKWEFSAATGRSPGGHDVGLTSFEVDVRNDIVWVRLRAGITNSQPSRARHE